MDEGCLNYLFFLCAFLVLACTRTSDVNLYNFLNAGFQPILALVSFYHVTWLLPYICRNKVSNVSFLGTNGTQKSLMQRSWPVKEKEHSSSMRKFTFTVGASYAVLEAWLWMTIQPLRTFANSSLLCLCTSVIFEWQARLRSFKHCLR